MTAWHPKSLAATTAAAPANVGLQSGVRAATPPSLSILSQR
jgi:hypothetical protein